MKLVNVDDLKVLVAVESKGEIRYGKLVTDLFDDIPTVKAIPVEWILHYVDTHYNVDNYDDIWRYIMKMHDEWEEENERP